MHKHTPTLSSHNLKRPRYTKNIAFYGQKEYIDFKTLHPYRDTMKSLLPKTVIVCLFLSAATSEPPYKSFREHFGSSSPKYFSYVSSGNKADVTRAFGLPSSTEPGTTVCLSK
jgi:hypothetical protein